LYEKNTNKIYSKSYHARLTIVLATGKLGIPVAKILLHFGFELKLIVRNKEKAQRIFGHTSTIRLNKPIYEMPTHLKRH